VSSPARIESAWEETAHELWVSLGKPTPPIDSYKLCAALGLRVMVSRTPLAAGNSFLSRTERLVHISDALSPAQRYFAAAHEAVHWLLPEETKERRISYIAMAILLPREHVEAPMEASWDLWALGDSLAPHLSPEVLSRRLLSLRSDAAVSVWKEGRPLAALRWPALRYAQPAAVERTMATKLFADRESDRVDLGERLYAVADDTAAGRFVITVAEAHLVRGEHDTHSAMAD
jgi:hypothetical protein